MEVPELDASVSTPGDLTSADVDVVIVSYRTPDLVLDCIESVVAASPRTITVVDNASGDGTVERVRSRHPDVRVVANDRNLGYGAAANAGAAVGDGPVVLVLNGDTLVEPNAAGAFGEHFRRSPEAGLVGPVIRRTDGSLQRSTYPFPSLADAVLGETGLHILIGRIPFVRERFLRTWSHDRTRSVDWVVGAAFAVRRSAFEAIGGFDEGYFMYSEEVDLCRRMHDAGHDVEFAPLTVVTHVGEASAKQDRHAMDRERQSSAVRYLRCHASSRSAAALLSFQRLVTLLRTVRDLLLSIVGAPDQRRARRAEAEARWRLLRERALWKP